MDGPSMVGWLLGAVSLATGVLCLLRARGAAGLCGRRTARAEAVMGLGMALMAVPRIAPGQEGWGPPLLAVVFAALAVRSVAFARGEEHRVHHTFEAAVMVYMAVVMAAMPGSTGMSAMAGMDHGTMGVPAVNLASAGYFVAYAV